MVQPPERVTPRVIPAREYVFVVDVSGSMNGFPLKTAKTLLESLLEEEMAPGKRQKKHRRRLEHRQGSRRPAQGVGPSGKPPLRRCPGGACAAGNKLILEIRLRRAHGFDIRMWIARMAKIEMVLDFIN